MPRMHYFSSSRPEYLKCCCYVYQSTSELHSYLKIAKWTSPIRSRCLSHRCCFTMRAIYESVSVNAVCCCCCQISPWVPIGRLAAMGWSVRIADCLTVFGWLTSRRCLCCSTAMVVTSLLQHAVVAVDDHFELAASSSSNWSHTIAAPCMRWASTHWMWSSARGLPWAVSNTQPYGFESWAPHATSHS